MIGIFASYQRTFYFVGLIVLLITAIFSTGYFHADEHFQILELINYKLGKTPLEELPWEFTERMRPSIQVALGYGMVKLLNTIGVNNPFTYTLIFRLITALSCWLLLFKISKILLKDFISDSDKKLFLGMLFLLWFVPLIGVRFSSENICALTFFTGVYLLLRNGNNLNAVGYWQFVLVGLILGFSFYFRFQIGFAIVGLFAWLLLIQKFSILRFLVIALAMFIAFLISTGFDFWLYGELTCTPYNYLRANIIENKAANFGVSPWWNYLKLFIFKVTPPISLILLIAFLIGLSQKPKSVFTWCIIPFIVGHSLIGHKELRFMFPMTIAFIYIAAFGLNHLLINITLSSWRKYFLYLVIFINAVYLLGVLISPAQPVVNLYKFLYEISNNRKIEILCKEKSPFEIRNLNVYFYKTNNLDCIVVNNDNDLYKYLEIYQPESIMLLERRFHLTNNFKDYSIKRVYSSLPEWLENFNVSNWLGRTSIWCVFELKRLN